VISRSLWRVILGVLALSVAADGLHAETRALRFGRDLFVGGDEVALRSAVAGDALLAGARVTLDASVAGDVVAAGGELDLAGSVGDHLYAAGGKVRIEAAVSGSARIAGGEVRLLPSAKITEGLSVAGGRVALEGEVGSYAQIAGGSIRIDGRVGGNVEAAGGELQVGPNAVIEGSLTFRGSQAAAVAPGAKVRDGVRNITHERAAWRRAWPAIIGVLAFVWFAGWALVGGLLLGLFPNATRRVTSAARARPWLAALVGFIALIVVPAVIALLLATLIGIPLALLTLLLYLVLLPLGWLAGVATIGDWLLPRLRRGVAAPSTGWRIAIFVVALLIVAILTQIPFIGWLAGLLLWVIGIGAILLVVQRREPAASVVATLPS
jgi:hypothetical protein